MKPMDILLLLLSILSIIAFAGIFIAVWSVIEAGGFKVIFECLWYGKEACSGT